MLRNLFVSAFLAALCISALAQAKPAAVGPRWQVGAGYSFGPPDYTLPYIKGVSAYATYDVRSRTGFVVEVHLQNLSTPQYIGESSFLAGGRYGFTKGIFHPYLKALIGVGVFQRKPGFVPKSGTDNYEVFGAGAGVDLYVARHINVRAMDFEYQGWPGFPPDGLTPWILTTGAAYRF